MCNSEDIVGVTITDVLFNYWLMFPGNVWVTANFSPFHSYAVVLWELLTGERPYYGLNLFVVAYGVGHGTLSLPIPDGCPEDLGDLMRGKWLKYVWDGESVNDVKDCASV